MKPRPGRVGVTPVQVAQRRRLLWWPLLWMLCGLLNLPLSARAQTLRLLIPYPPGGAVDAIARRVELPLHQALAQDLVLENHPGAAGALGLRQLLATSPQGPDMAMGSDSDAILVPLLNPQIRFSSEQFRLLGVLARVPIVLVGGRNAPALDEGLARARRTGGEPLRLGSYGVGSNAHLLAESLAQRAGAAIVHVPHQGLAPVLQNLEGGHVEWAFMPLAGSVPGALAQGRLRALAVAGAQRIAALPHVPTLAEGAGVHGLEYAAWSGILIARKAPDAVARRAHAAVQAALMDGALRRATVADGAEPGEAMSFDGAQQFFEAEIARIRRLAAAMPGVAR